MMKIGILEAGRPPQELAEFGSYAQMLERLVAGEPPDERFEFVTYAVLDGEFPSAITECAGWMITGSRHGVYDDLFWMQPLQNLIREIHADNRPLLGICFGHQIMATAMGGEVEKSDKGWGTGLHDYRLTAAAPAWMQASGGVLTLNAMHQDQVVTRPPRAEVIAQSDFCIYAGLRYSDTTLSFQGHPEFGIDYEQALLQLRQSAVIPDTVAKPALTRLQQPDAHHDGPLLGQWMREHFFTAGSPQ